MLRLGLHQYWRHTPTGQMWAVRIVDGELVGACGPLDPKEVPPKVLPYLPFHFRDVLWIRDNHRDFAAAAVA